VELASPTGVRGDPALAPGAEFGAGFWVAVGAETGRGCSSLLLSRVPATQNQSASATNNRAAANKPQGAVGRELARGVPVERSRLHLGICLAAAPSPDASR